MKKYIFFSMAMAFILLTGLSLGGLDQAGGTDARNLTMMDFSTLGVESNPEGTVVQAGAPQAAALDAGTEIAAYTDQAPVTADLRKAMPSAILTTPPQFMYYNGDYLAWDSFTTTFPSIQPGLWIERAVSWSWYATMPLGDWTRELLYVPKASPLTMYEVYPGGYVLGYDLGFVQPGYYYIWYYADVPGRHRSMFATSSGYSNSVVVDVYPLSIYVKPTPPKPDPKAECESNPLCSFVNGHCYCTGWIDDPERRKCEENPVCDWVDGHCYCRGLEPENPEKESCEQNPQCTWANGQCYCRGLNPEPQPEPEPMPGPVPNPNPEPGPFNPAPNPAANCQPGCYWSGGECRCTGLVTGGSSEDSGDQGDFATTAEGPST